MSVQTSSFSAYVDYHSSFYPLNNNAKRFIAQLPATVTAGLKTEQEELVKVERSQSLTLPSGHSLGLLITIHRSNLKNIEILKDSIRRAVERFHHGDPECNVSVTISIVDDVITLNFPGEH